MKITDTISVNPGKNALGHVETGNSIFRSPVLDVEKNAHSLEASKVLFPTTNAGTIEYKKYAVPLRTLFATILIVSGICALTMTAHLYSVAFAVCTISFGAFLALGLLTRPVMAGAAIFYCISGALALRAGTPDITLFSLMFGCVIFCVMGAGKYSCDQLIRHTLLRRATRSERKRRENAMGYKAFHNVRF